MPAWASTARYWGCAPIGRKFWLPTSPTPTRRASRPSISISRRRSAPRWVRRTEYAAAAKLGAAVAGQRYPPLPGAAQAAPTGAAASVKYQTDTQVTLDGNSVDLGKTKVAAAANAVDYVAGGQLHQPDDPHADDRDRRRRFSAIERRLAACRCSACSRLPAPAWRRKPSACRRSRAISPTPTARFPRPASPIAPARWCFARRRWTRAAMRRVRPGMAGVQVAGVVESAAPFRTAYDPDQQLRRRQRLCADAERQPGR